MKDWRIKFDVRGASVWETLTDAIVLADRNEDVSVLGTGHTKPEVQVGEVVFDNEPDELRVQAMQDIIELHVGVRAR